MDANRGAWLTLGAGLSFGVALLHVAIIVIGAPGYLYFGAVDLARLAAHGSFLPALLTLGLAAIFAGFGFYALSGAGLVRRLPLLTLGLIFVGSLYTLRGLVLVLDLLRLARGADYPLRQTLFSATSLAIGLVYLVGTARRWGYLKMQDHVARRR